jgi:SEL1 protein
MGDINAAAKYLEMAMRLGNSFEAPYHLATINARLARSLLGMYGGAETTARPVGPAGSPSHERCRLAVAGYKHAVERGDWADPLFARAERAWDKGERERALSLWAMAGERGYEAAQNNVAWLLDRDKRSLHLGALEEQPEADEAREAARDRLALIHWTRSAAQDNVDALVKVGDYYFKGIGITHGALDVEQAGGASVTRADGAAAPSASGSAGAATPQRSSRSEPAYDKAAACYAAAADRQVSALAYWNMGFLYESGLGVPQHDYALAKRYYDMAVEINHEAYLPVLLSLAKLHLRAIWATLRHGDASAIALLKSYALTAGGAAPDGAAPAYTEAEEQAALAALERLGDGRAGRAAPAGDSARGGLLRPDTNAMGEGGDPNLPETYDVRRRTSNASAAEEESDEELDDIIEGAFIVIGLAALAFLVYARQGAALRAERERRDLAQAQGGAAGPPAAQETGGPRPRVNERPEPPFPWPPEGANVYAGL